MTGIPSQVGFGTVLGSSPAGGGDLAWVSLVWVAQMSCASLRAAQGPSKLQFHFFMKGLSSTGTVLEWLKNQGRMMRTPSHQKAN